MTGTFDVHEDGTVTVAFSYTGLAPIIQTRADKAAHRLYSTGRYVPVDAEGIAVPWDDVTNQQKLNMLSEFVREGIHEEAMAQYDSERKADAAAYRAADAATIL